MKSERQRWLHTDKEGSGKSPFLSAANDREGKPMRWNERMKKRNCSNSSDSRQIFGAKLLVHYAATLDKSIFTIYNSIPEYEIQIDCAEIINSKWSYKNCIKFTAVSAAEGEICRLNCSKALGSQKCWIPRKCLRLCSLPDAKKITS